MYQRILRDPLRFPDEMHPEARSVITCLLQRDPNKRLGNGGAEEIKNHPFFAKYVDWNAYVSIFFWVQPDVDGAEHDIQAIEEEDPTSVQAFGPECGGHEQLRCRVYE